MPRRNRNIPHKTYKASAASKQKRRFATRKQAEEAAEYSMLLNPNLELYAYREINGGWYLTSRSPNK